MTRGPDYQKERGERQEQRILTSLAAQPKTPLQLATALAMTQSNVSIYMRRLRAAPKRIYVVDHDTTARGRVPPIFAVGDLPDVVYQPKRKPKLPDRVDTRMQQIRELLTTPRTTQELAVLMHLTSTRVQHYVRQLREATPKEAFIKDWQHPGKRGDLAPIYALGNRPDKKKPRETLAQRYAREKKDPDKYSRILAQRRKLHHLAKARSKPNTWMNVLAGASRAMSRKAAP